MSQNGICLEKTASMPAKRVFEDLKTSPNGLTSEKAKLRLIQYDYNQLSEKKTKNIN
jgi:Cation transporter/ATPase, N-terminus